MCLPLYKEDWFGLDFNSMQQYSSTMEKTTTTACHGGGGGDPFLLLLHLPEEVLIQILERVPVVSLLRFKCVCKSWRDLIQNSYFSDLHTNNTFNSSSSTSSKFGTFILRSEEEEEDVILMLSEYEGGSKSENGDWYRCTDGSWHKFTTSGGNGDDQLLLKVDNLLEVPYNLFIAGSCNGLICLHDTELRDVSLWNPATRQFRILPKSITIEIFDDDDFVAFGFDVKTKDYKVLLISPYDGRPTSRVQVYSLSTDSWRLINSPPLVLPAEQYNGLYMNGCCFFLANVYNHESNTNNMFINSFDFTKEIFITIQLPDHHDPRQYLYLSCFGGGEKLALFTTLQEYNENDPYDPYGYEDCDIWVLNEHDCAVSKESYSSWTKLHSFQIKKSRGGKPMGISNNGKFAFLEITEESYWRKIQVYDLVTKQVKMDIPFNVCRSQVYVYKPSLASVIGGNGLAAAARPMTEFAQSANLP